MAGSIELYERSGAAYISGRREHMRPEIQRTVEDIQQAIALLRRHL
jgi:sulfite reductase alpha subunit-like flavoprotein